MKKCISIALVITLANAVSASSSDDMHGIPPTLLHELNTWLDAETEFRKRINQPRIHWVGTAQAEVLRGATNHSDGRTRGLYDNKVETIYLTEPWTVRNPHDVSVLLHEMVHHRQSQQHWYCPQAQEWRAYQIQAQWLDEQNIDGGFYWPAILLQSSCTKHDIHPD